MAIDKPAIIHYDPGGVVEDYMARERSFELQGKKIVIDGNCASACTLYTRSPDLCVTRRAAFYFHQAADGMDRDHLVGRDDEVTASMMTFYPARISEWIKRKGGLTSHMLVLRGREMLSYFKLCQN
ncbi:hypothetical protein CU048_00030 [Beijerinckiaceae bacterium]|nr:hypothetical protein CU048_00030 [Beijerinckiaceae bacterium]